MALPVALSQTMKVPFPYKEFLVIGATSGIGKALATKLVENGTPVIISGRRKENLDVFVEEHGSDKVKTRVFDIMQLDKVNPNNHKNLERSSLIWMITQIPQFAAEVIADNPDLDCIFVNSGIQRPFHFSRPDTIDLDVFNQELITNYTSAVHLTKAFFPHLQAQQSQTALAFTTSQLALVPMMRCPNYGASKAGRPAPFHPGLAHAAAEWTGKCEDAEDLSACRADRAT